MTDPKPIHRLEETSGDRLRVVTKDHRDLWGDHPEGRTCVLTREYEDLWTYVVPKKGGFDRVRVGTAAHIGDCDGWHIHGANGIYAEVPFAERELTEAERAYCEEHFMYRNTESAIEFEIPHPEDLRSAIRDQDLERFDCLDAMIEDHEKRHDVLTELQERIVEESVRANRLKPRSGFPVDLYPEWDPDDSHNDGKTRQHLYDMASMRSDSHRCDFDPVAGFRYAAFRNARHRVLGVHEPNLEPHEIPHLDVAGYPEWAYCRECGAVSPSELFLHVPIQGYDDRTMRACERCADRFVDWEIKPSFTEDSVAQAKNDRAQRTGGQRTLAGEYSEN